MMPVALLVQVVQMVQMV